MPKELTWEDAEDLGILLSEQHPEMDPLAVRFTDLHRLVTELPGFRDDPRKSNEASWKPSRWRGTRSSWTARKPNATYATLFGGIQFPIVLLQQIKRLLVLSEIRNQSFAVVIILCAGQQAAG